MIKISAVTYLNTKPFVYGIKNSGFLDNYTLELDIPSVCADKLISGSVDISLIPVAVIPMLKKYEIVTDYCIGAVGKVRSVVLYSDVALNRIEKVYLDYQSRTSVLLAQILAEMHWNIKPVWVDAEPGFENDICAHTAGVVIGDRALAMQDKYNYAYDLAEEWYHFTSLPFVFACWLANKPLPADFAEAFCRAVEWGVQNREKVIMEEKNTLYNSQDYINNCISYELDAQKRKGMELFLDYAKKFKALSLIDV